MSASEAHGFYQLIPLQSPNFSAVSPQRHVIFIIPQKFVKCPGLR